MPGSLQHRIYFCLTGGRAIFLDLRRNRYFALPSQLNTEFVRLVADRYMGVVTQADISGLGRGDGGDSQSMMPFAVTGTDCPPVPMSDRSQGKIGGKAAPGMVIAAWLAIGLAKLAISMFPLWLIVSFLSAGQRTTRGQINGARVDRIARAFHRAELLVGNEGNCLSLTLAYVAVCRVLGQYPDFFIGVRVNPFSAHCWCQSGSIVLNDTLERVRPYQPIVII